VTGRRRIQPKYFAFFAIPLLAVAAVLAFFPLDRNPSDFRVEGSSLIVLNKHGRTLWAYDTKLPKPKEKSSYRFAFPDKTYRKLEVGEIAEFPFVIFRDLDAADMKGTSPEGPLHQFAESPDGTERFYVRLAV